MVSDGPHGLRAQPGAGDHVGLGGSLPATCFPTASAVASTWNPELLRRIGAALAQEARACNLSVILGPGINMKRSPLCGRNFEYFSEDPYLAGELGVGIVDGIQAAGVGTSVKHYAANNQETDRLRVDAQVDERTLREIYFRRSSGSSPPASRGRSCAPTTRSTASRPRRTRGCWHACCARSSGSRGSIVSDWGAVYHRAPALLAGSTWRCRPNLPRSPDQVARPSGAGRWGGRPRRPGPHGP
jgi:beta-glucosidase